MKKPGAFRLNLDGTVLGSILFVHYASEDTRKSGAELLPPIRGIFTLTQTLTSLYANSILKFSTQRGLK